MPLVGKAFSAVLHKKALPSGIRYARKTPIRLPLTGRPQSSWGGGLSLANVMDEMDGFGAPQ